MEAINKTLKIHLEKVGHFNNFSMYMEKKIKIVLVFRVKVK